MTAAEFKAWRKKSGFKSRALAAQALGLSPETVRLYETGIRREDPSKIVVIPRHIALACAAISAGLEPVGECEAEYD
ncbi:helix-turn-helix domain-containing protein [Polycladidibacter stylochi]|uniref:helix-turn-helix domain-containing protein n=1 Tax=Polycladidibacter stylochi TaxID=1807766 RepID=UPI000830AF29|nr:helix-turn-helix domain-containing protein [Pseudovibrio stylochi]